MRPALALLVTGLAVQAGPAKCQAPADVPQGHWAYEAVQDLASKGLVKGYPPTGNFFGRRTVTRYEMASLVQRVLAQIDEMMAKKADKGDTAAAPSGVTPEQLSEVRKLVEDFRVELTVMGTNLKSVQDELGALKGDVANIKTTADQAAADAAAAKSGVDDVRLGLTGTIDAIHEQASRVDKLQAHKVEAGAGKIQIDGLMQAWIQAPIDANSAKGFDTFRLRRMEIKLSGALNPQTYWTVMFDPAKSLSLNTTSTAGNLTGATVNNTSNILQDAFMGLKVTPSLSLEIGQQKVPMSMEGLRSSSQLTFVERSIFNTLPVNNGRVGDIRDLGGLVRLSHPLVDAQLAVFNDAGNLQNGVDNNNNKELIYHLDFKGVRNLVIGGYGEASGGVGGIGAAKTVRNRWGVEGSYTLGRHRLEAEGVRARDGGPQNGAKATYATGGYVAYAYKASPMWELAARGEYWNPNRDLHGAAVTQEYDLTLGANYYLTSHNSKIQLNWVRKNINGPLNAAGTGPSALSALGVDRSMFLVNFQQAF